jgi:hypothetical protein
MIYTYIYMYNHIHTYIYVYNHIHICIYIYHNMHTCVFWMDILNILDMCEMFEVVPFRWLRQADGLLRRQLRPGEKAPRTTGAEWMSRMNLRQFLIISSLQIKDLQWSSYLHWISLISLETWWNLMKLQMFIGFHSISRCCLARVVKMGAFACRNFEKIKASRTLHDPSSTLTALLAPKSLM